MSDDEEAKVSPLVLQTAFLHSITKLLREMNVKMEHLNVKMENMSAVIREGVTEGIVEPLRGVIATTTSTAYKPPYAGVGKLWFSMSIVNDGPSDCWIVVNTEKSSNQPYEIMVDEVYEVDMKKAQIIDMLVWTDAGTASLRIRGVR